MTRCPYVVDKVSRRLLSGDGFRRLEELLPSLLTELIPPGQ